MLSNEAHRVTGKKSLTDDSYPGVDHLRGCSNRCNDHRSSVGEISKVAGAAGIQVNVQLAAGGHQAARGRAKCLRREVGIDLIDPGWPDRVWGHSVVVERIGCNVG